MPVFYANRFVGQDAVLDEEESRHIIRVLRMKANDPVELVDGKGNLYRGTILSPDPAGTRVRILDITRDYLARAYHLHLAIAPTKSTDRFEWFLEKATEIGVDEITPVICARSERNRIRQERSEKIILAAMKQSGRALLPVLHPVVPLTVFLDSAKADFKYIAHCGKSERRSIQEAVTRYSAAGKPVPRQITWLVLIGPEGDFTVEEVDKALETGYEGISLGEAVYRTETAGILACQLVNFLSPA